jgi:hypothetical protein
MVCFSYSDLICPIRFSAKDVPLSTDSFVFELMCR